MGDLRVLQTARQSLDYPRHRVLRKSPNLKGLRSAHPLARPSGSRFARRFPPKALLSSVYLDPNQSRAWHYQHRSTCRFVALHSLRYFVLPPPAAIIAESASPSFVARLGSAYLGPKAAFLLCSRLGALPANRSHQKYHAHSSFLTDRSHLRRMSEYAICLPRHTYGLLASRPILIGKRA